MTKEKSIYYLDSKEFDTYIEYEVKSKKYISDIVEPIDEMNCSTIEGNLWDNIKDDSGLPF